jgi:DNA helicase-2/ATP-dependent DNA helicase PcrA
MIFQCTQCEDFPTMTTFTSSFTSSTHEPCSQGNSKLLDALNPNQRRAVEQIKGATLVLAGAGSGKTRVIIARIEELLHRGVSPTQILAVTFTNKAAKEMALRLQQHGHGHNGVLVSTFHGLGSRILREQCHQLGYQRTFAIYDEDDAHTLLDAVLKEIGIKSRDLTPSAFKKRISSAKMNCIMPDELSKAKSSSELETNLPRVYTLYLERMKQANAMDFDDLIFFPLLLFKQFPAIAQHYSMRWPYLLVDEYQDTNHSQYQLLCALTTASTSLFVVGDPDQSIYSWRGADINNILQFEEDFAGSSVIRLEENYRSTAHILQAANGLISRNKDRYEKNLISTKGMGRKVHWYPCSSDLDEASTAVQIIRQHQREGISLKEMALFYRTNGQSRLFEEALLRAKIPYRIFGGVGFYQRREIKDIIAYLRIALDSNDYAALNRTINLPKNGLGEVFVRKLMEVSYQSSQPPFLILDRIASGQEIEGLKVNQKQKAAIGQYLSGIRAIIGAAKNPPHNRGPISAAVEAAYISTPYMAYLKEEQETLDERKENIESLVGKALEWEESCGETPTLEAFLEELTLEQSVSHDQHAGDQLNLMTVHNSKGLEFSLVLLTGLEEELFPHAFSYASAEALEEERRLCYVGMTRAKEFLYLLNASYRYFRGSPTHMSPSRFLGELSSKHVDRIIDGIGGRSKIPNVIKTPPSDEWRERKSPVSSFRQDNELTSPAAIPTIPGRGPVVPTQKAPVTPKVVTSQRNDPVPLNPGEEFKSGSRVRHPSFGDGVIQEVLTTSLGVTYRVLFNKERSIRTLIGRYANLTLLSET